MFPIEESTQSLQNLLEQRTELELHNVRIGLLLPWRKETPAQSTAIKIGLLNWVWILYSLIFRILVKICLVSHCHNISISVDYFSLCGKMIVMNPDGNVVIRGLVLLVPID